MDQFSNSARVVLMFAQILRIEPTQEQFVSIIESLSEINETSQMDDSQVLCVAMTMIFDSNSRNQILSALGLSTVEIAGIANEIAILKPLFQESFNKVLEQRKIELGVETCQISSKTTSSI